MAGPGDMRRIGYARQNFSEKQEVYCMLEEISFPEQEYESIQNYLSKLGYCYTTRVYKEIGKYKVGELYTAPWGDILKIDEVKTYWKVSDRPFYDEMNDDEKTEIRKYSEDIGLPYEFIKFSKSTVSLYSDSRNTFPKREKEYRSAHP